MNAASEMGRVGARSRELAAMGLGGFADFVAETEATPFTKTVEPGLRPGAQVSTPRLSKEEFARFEEKFQNGSEKIGSPRPSDSGAISFARAFKMSGSNSATPEESESARVKTRFSFQVSDCEATRVVEPTQAAPLTLQQGQRSFDLGAFYDRIGLEREDAAALTRILQSDAAQGASTDDIERIEGLLAELIDEPTEDPAEAAARAAVRDVAADSLCESLDAFGRSKFEAAGPAAPKGAGRLTLALDEATMARLLAAAEARGESLRDMAMQALNGACAMADLAEAPKRAVPEETPIAGASPYDAA